MFYTISSPNEYLAITGYGIKDIKLAKNAFIWPLQKCMRFDVSPVNYTFDVQAMSSENLPFILPAVFTIGPCDRHSNHVRELVEGVIEGETRVLAASMSMEDIFKGTKEFKKEVFDKVQLELNKFGLLIYNANVKQLVDVRGHESFSYLGQKTQMEAANQAKVDVAEAKMKGEVGSKIRDSQTQQNAAKIDAETRAVTAQRQGEGKKEEIRVMTDVKIFENQKEADVAQVNAELAKKKAGWSQVAKLAEVEAAKAVSIREAELQTEVEYKNAMTRTAKLKAEMLTQAAVEYDTKVQEANWALYKKQREADAIFYENQKAAEAQKASSEATFYANQQAADAELYRKKKEAEGIRAFAQAEGFYLSTLLKELKGNYAALRDYMMVSKDMFKEIATINAQAVNGLQPKISIWSTGKGGQEANGVGGMKDIADIYTMLPPLMKTVNEQTGMLPPAWLGTLSDTSASN